MNNNQAARAAALAAVAEVPIEPTSLVAFNSKGWLLILGPARKALAVAQQLATTGVLTCIVLAEGAEEVGEDTAIPVFYRGHRELSLQGYLGEFTVVLSSEQNNSINLAQVLDSQRSSFDLILDLSATPHMIMEVPPLGYYAPVDEQTLNQVLSELPEMVGEFEKPKFFDYNSDICAHGQKGLPGCRACLEACPTEAISSLVERIQIDPFLCQGGGSCASVCPSGAIQYRYPGVGDTVNGLRALLKTYSEQGGQDPVVVFYGDDFHPQTDAWPGSLLPVQVEEIGSLGMEVWLSALAYGASAVQIGITRQTPASVVTAIRQQLEVARALLRGMGYAEQALAEWTTETPELESWIPAITPAAYAGFDDKRTLLFLAVDHLHAQAPKAQTQIDLPVGASFGQILVDQEACTLCMGCAGVCPPFALSAGGEEPKLIFTEAVCIQCGLCEMACPEQAISRQPRFLYSSEQRRRPRTLYEEGPFCCIRCGKPFATQAMIKAITSKLQGHWMYQNQASLQRLQMCENCRVEGLFEDHTT